MPVRELGDEIYEIFEEVDRLNATRLHGPPFLSSFLHHPPDDYSRLPWPGPLAFPARLCPERGTEARRVLFIVSHTV